LLVAQNLAGLAATCLRAEPLVMVIARIGGKPFFATMAFAAMAFVFHKKHHRQPQFGHNLKNWNNNTLGISHPHTERASCLHYMARSRRQGCAPCHPSPPP
jgi:hypothetical protein